MLSREEEIVPRWAVLMRRWKDQWAGHSGGGRVQWQRMPRGRPMANEEALQGEFQPRPGLGEYCPLGTGRRATWVG